MAARQRRKRKFDKIEKPDQFSLREYITINQPHKKRKCQQVNHQNDKQENDLIQNDI